MRGDAFGARGDLVTPGAAFRARGKVVLGGAFRAGDFLIEIRAQLSVVQMHRYPSFCR